MVEVTGRLIPPDSTASPVVIPIDESRLKRISVSHPDITFSDRSIRFAQNPKVVVAGTPLVSIPGKDGYLLPTVTATKGHTLLTGIPEVVLAKDPSSKDSNPQNFRSFGKLQGLNDDLISSMLEDQFGNLWFGTYGAGVSKYDGKYFSHYTEKEGLSNNNVYCMLEDRSGNLWFGTFGGGVTRYDGKYVTHFTVKEGLPNNSVMSIFEDRAGNLWLGTNGGGVCRFDDSTMQSALDSFTHFTIKQGLAGDDVRSILEDRSGNIWFGTAGGGVSKYTPPVADHPASFTTYTEKEGLSNNTVLSIVEDQAGNLWFGTMGGGLNKYDGKSFTHFTETDGLSANVVTCILEAKSGNLWLGTTGGGMCEYERAIVPGVDDSFKHFTQQEGLPGSAVTSILEDQSGNLWVGTVGGGVSRYDGRSFIHMSDGETLADNNVQAIVEDHLGNLWLGTGNKGVSKYNGRSFTHISEKDGLPNSNVTSVLEDRLGNIWLGTWGGGVSKYVPTQDRTGFIINYTVSEGLSSNYILCISEDHEGCIWFGTSGGGASKYVPATNGRTASFVHFNQRQGLSNNIVYSILEDQSEHLWFGTTGGGLCRYEPGDDNGAGRFTHYTVREGLPDNEVRGLLEDSAGNLWFGTNGGGVAKFDIKSLPLGPAQLIKFTEAEGLPSDIVFRVLEDHSGNIWFSTQKGLSKLERSKGENSYLNQATPFKNFAYADGLLSVGCSALCEDRNGMLWIASEGKLAIHQPSTEVPIDSIPPRIQVTAVKLFNEQIPWTSLENNRDSTMVLGNGVVVGDFEFDEVTKWYGLPKNLVLSYDNNYVTFDFVGITQNSPRKIKYQYMLDGADKNWSTIVSQTDAPYGNLPHGSYTFKVKARNADGYWSDEFQFPFVIRPPWWFTSWAYGIYVLALVSISFLQYRYQKTRLLRKEREKAQQKELEQAQQIVRAYDELEEAHKNLKATQSQLIHAEKMASLGELTTGIAHEIQNPLNFVNNFSEVNSELARELMSAAAKGDLDEVQSLAKSIQENEDKIATHGKRADGIVKSMMQHSRRGSGQKELTDINQLADEYLRLAYHGFRAKDKSFSATYETNFDQSLERISVVPQDIGRVLLNIISNAFYAVTQRKFKGESGYQPTVTVTTVRNSGSTEIRVKDNGVGISESVKTKIFQPFFTTKPAGEGTGLGLSLSYDIVTKGHGGTITVTSAPNGGAEFTIQLPTKS